MIHRLERPGPRAGLSSCAQSSESPFAQSTRLHVQPSRLDVKTVRHLRARRCSIRSRSAEVSIDEEKLVAMKTKDAAYCSPGAVLTCSICQLTCMLDQHIHRLWLDRSEPLSSQSSSSPGGSFFLSRFFGMHRRPPCCNSRAFLLSRPSSYLGAESRHTTRLCCCCPTDRRLPSRASIPPTIRLRSFHACLVR